MSTAKASCSQPACVMQQRLTLASRCGSGRFKFIPRVVEAPWVVRKGVGTQPAILGNKLLQTYHTDAKLNYLEVCCFGSLFAHLVR